MLHLYWYTSNVHISQVSVVYVCKICPTWVDVNDLCLVNYYTCKKLHCNNQSFFHHFLKISVKYWLCPICADSSGRTSSFRVKYPNTSGGHLNNHGDEDEDDDEDADTLVIKEEYPEGGSVHGAQESSPPTTCKWQASLSCLTAASYILSQPTMCDNLNTQTQNPRLPLDN